MKSLGKKFILTIGSTLLAGHLFAAPYSNFIVRGNENLTDEVILGIAGLRNGTAADADEINAAIQRMFDAGLFSRIHFTPTNANTVVITVVELPTVNRIFFDGNDKIDDDILRQVVKIGPRSGADSALIEADAAAIRQVYTSRSLFDVTVEPQLQPLANGTTNVIFAIDEGNTSEIERITFDGNQDVPDRSLLGAVNAREAGNFSGLFRSDNFTSETLISDRDRLEDYYAENGYPNAVIDVADTVFSEFNEFFVNYDIQEGQRFRFGNVDILSTINGVNGEDYRRFIDVRPGAYYKRSQITATQDAIEIAAEARGLPFLRAQPRLIQNPQTGTVDVVFELVRAPRQFIERIDIHGNNRTADRIIRRQFESVEGDPVNDRKIEQARRGTQRLGYFDQVAVNIRDGSLPDQKIVDVEVSEQPTGSANFGLNYGGDSIAGTVDFSQPNFLGNGQQVDIGLSYSSTQRSANFSFREPGLFERDVNAGFNIYYNDIDNDAGNFSTTNFGLEPDVLFPISDNSSLSVGAFYRSLDIRDVNESASPLVKLDEGELSEFGLALQWDWNRLNSNVNPTKGWRMRLRGEYAGLGGDVEYTRAEAAARGYYSILNDNVTFILAGEAGAISTLNDDVPIRINNRYFLGGNDMLGFDSGGIGPRDVTTDVNTSLGGNNFARARAEVVFPIGLPEELGLKGGAFYDIGSVWGLDRTVGGASGTIDDALYWRQSRGLSVIWQLGSANLRFSWTDPFDAQPNDSTKDFHISLQTSF